jgi:hypothetical protein
MTEPADTSDTSSAFDALLREVARQSHVGVAPQLVPGKKLDGGRLEILRRIGEGGMGVVYEAFDAVRREKKRDVPLDRARLCQRSFAPRPRLRFELAEHTRGGARRSRAQCRARREAPPRRNHRFRR